MVKSCFDEEFLKAWNRSPTSSSANDAKERLENLMLFLKGEVEGEERISLAMSDFGVTKGEDVKMSRKKKYNLETQRGKIPTASMLLASTRATEVKKPKCIFCDGKHVSSDCFNAQKLTLEEKQKIVRDKNCCFACLLPGHSVRKCRKFLKCPVCSKKHVTLMCDQLQAFKNTNQEENPSGNDVNLSNVNPKVFLQTFKAKLLSRDKEKTVRVLCDTGSQKLYILKNISEEMKYSVSRQETIKHSLFGGVSTKESVICENVLPVSEGPWLDELKGLGVVLTDTNVSSESMQVLIGADIIDNRYEVYLPWADDSFPLPDNFNLAKKRLEVTTEKLLSSNLYDKYENVFQEWLDEGIIEEVPPNEVALYGNYLPHRPVIKESSSTTPIRPVPERRHSACQFRGISSPGGLILSQDVTREISQIRVYAVRPLHGQEIIRENFVVTTVHRAPTARTLSHSHSNQSHVRHSTLRSDATSRQNTPLGLGVERKKNKCPESRRDNGVWSTSWKKKPRTSNRLNFGKESTLVLRSAMIFRIKSGETARSSVGASRSRNGQERAVSDISRLTADVLAANQET
ncbi:hypothetical protein AVEN_147914-1 [Araneus ventricosus]|uniref:Peptidase aspartic putative domain-containing protein n=1 Tax=Araneus ventricosus TaxID=182803 RepID=A0A4Y2NU66_ARAVE|nr:hypothetical protein AVEN_147914-1 [Araneus ventricosus]